MGTIYLTDGDDLTSVANAIRAKSGGSGQIAFPTGFVSEIGNIPSGNPLTMAHAMAEGTLTEYIDPELTKVRGGVFNTGGITSFVCHAVTTIANDGLAKFNGTGLAFPNLSSIGQTSVANSTTLRVFDVGGENAKFNNQIIFRYDSNLDTLILRKDSIVPLNNVNVFTGTPFASGKSGGTIYIPQSLYNHLGDGTSLDYKAATNWSTIDGYGTITWAKIEGSIYETKYGDGTTIPTS